MQTSIREMIEALLPGAATGADLPRERRAEEERIAAVPLRPLGRGETRVLERNGSRCPAWRRVAVGPGFDPRQIRNCRFGGDVVLVGGGQPLLADSVVEDCVIGHGARVESVGRLTRCVVASGAVVERVGRLGMEAADGPRDFGNGVRTPGRAFLNRTFPICAGLSFELVAWLAGPDGADPANATLARRIEEAASHGAAAMRSERAYVGESAVIRDSRVVQACFIGAHTRIDAVSMLLNSTFAQCVILGGLDATDSVVLGSKLTGPSTIHTSVIGAGCEIGPQAMIKHSAVAGGCRIRCGEVHDSVIGPGTFALHQSTILAAWWPEGRGNISYGSNVGSNHTGRAPDQEIFPGEGTFFGLGCNIKMPANFREAPHSIIASGLTLLPQKVSFPFSLIMERSAPWPMIPPAIHEIRPAWGLRHNAYGIERHEQKYGAESPAHPDQVRPVRPPILRPHLMNLCAKAAEALESVGGRDHYTERELPGLGKNFMTEAARLEAIEIYRESIRIAAALLTVRVNRDLDGEVPWCRHEDADRWIRTTLEMKAGAGETERKRLVRPWLQLWLKFVTESRRKDWERGLAVLDDYARRHVAPQDDPVILALDELIRDQTSQAGVE